MKLPIDGVKIIHRILNQDSIGIYLLTATELGWKNLTDVNGKWHGLPPKSTVPEARRPRVLPSIKDLRDKLEQSLSPEEQKEWEGGPYVKGGVDFALGGGKAGRWEVATATPEQRCKAALVARALAKIEARYREMRERNDSPRVDTGQ